MDQHVERRDLRLGRGILHVRSRVRDRIRLINAFGVTGSPDGGEALMLLDFHLSQSVIEHLPLIGIAIVEIHAEQDVFCHR